MNRQQYKEQRTAGRQAKQEAEQAALERLRRLWDGLDIDGMFQHSRQGNMLKVTLQFNGTPLQVEQVLETMSEG